MSQAERETTETLQRVRRIETRLTSLLIANGIGTQVQTPTFVAGEHCIPPIARMVLPSHHSSLKEIMGAIPTGWAGDIELFVGTDRVAKLVVWDRT